MKMEEAKFDQHPMFTSSAMMHELLLPLKPFGITHLTVGIIRKGHDTNNTIEYLSTEPEILIPYFTEKFYQSLQGGDPDNFVDANILTKMYGYECDSAGQYASLVRDQFGVDYGIDLIRKFKGHCEIYFFSSHPDNYFMENFYLNNIDKLDSFICSFQEKAKKLLSESFKNRIDCPNGGDQTIASCDDWQSKFLKKMPNVKLDLTKREVECVYHLKQGLRTKQIADKLFVSSRTAEKYIASLKKKLKAQSINQMLIKLCS